MQPLEFLFPFSQFPVPLPPLNANVDAAHPYVRAIDKSPLLVRVLQRHLPHTQKKNGVSHQSSLERDKPSARRQMSVGKATPTNLKVQHQRRHDLVNLHGADILAQADMIPGPELKHGLFHLLDLFGACEPTLGPVIVGVGAENGSVALNHPGVDADDGTGGDVVAADHGAGGRNDALVVETEGRMQAEGFLDAGVEVG